MEQVELLEVVEVIADNLAFPLRERKAVNGFSAADIASRVAKIAGELEIENLLKRKPKTLSLFQKQLVAIGRALMRPDVSPYEVGEDTAAQSSTDAAAELEDRIRRVVAAKEEQGAPTKRRLKEKTAPQPTTMHVISAGPW